MSANLKSVRLSCILVFALILAAASFDVVYKYFGWTGAGLYSGLVLVTVVLAHKLLRIGIAPRFSERTIVLLAIATFAALAIIAIAFYPLANSGRFGGGSDADDALILAATELISGRYPFYPATYLGNAIAPLPGAVILAVPFVFAQLLPIQNVVWLAVFFLILRRELKSTSSALALFSLVLLLSPAIAQNLVTATDRTANAIYILAGAWMMITLVAAGDRQTWKKALAAVFFGIALSSRSNFGLIAPLIFSYLVQNAGWRTAWKYGALSALSALLVTLPFWLFDPAGFSPLFNQSEKIRKFESLVPYATVLVPAAGLLLSAILALRSMSGSFATLWWSCAITQIFSVFLLSMLSSLYLGEPDLYFGHVSYGVFFLFFAVMAHATRLGENGIFLDRTKAESHATSFALVS
ncbi:MAG: hypothetical protein WKF34_09185 [Pyrinomonadaceae bacterium]